jgi:hypothetical protein
MTEPDLTPHTLLTKLATALAEGRSAPPEGGPADALVKPDIPTLATRAGYVGPIVSEADRRLLRFYLDEALQTWLLIPVDDIVYRHKLRDANAPFGERDVVWFRSDATIRRFRRPPRAPIEETEFRIGEITAEEPEAAAGPPASAPATSAPASTSAQPSPVRPEHASEDRPAEREDPVALALFEAVVVDKPDGSAAKPREPVAAVAKNDTFRANLVEDFDRMVRARLGPRHSVYSVDVAAGTLEVLLFVGTVGVVIQAYEPIRKSLDLLKKDLEQLLRRLLKRSGHTNVEVERVSWTPGHTMLERESSEQDIERDGEPESRRGRLTSGRDLLVLYLVLAHALMLLFLFAVIVVLLVDALPSASR